VVCLDGRNYSLVCEFVKKLLDACECPVCQELCCQPRMLPCSHTFCERCLKGCTSNVSNSRWFPRPPKCPLCRQVYSQPAEGLRALPTNKLLSRILDKLSEPGMFAAVFHQLCEFSFKNLSCRQCIVLFFVKQVNVIEWNQHTYRWKLWCSWNISYFKAMLYIYYTRQE